MRSEADMNDLIRAVEATGLDWTRDGDVVHVTCFDGAILDAAIVRLQGHDYLVSGSDRNGTATNYGMKRIDGAEPDSIRAYIQGIAGEKGYHVRTHHRCSGRTGPAMEMHRRTSHHPRELWDSRNRPSNHGGATVAGVCDRRRRPYRHQSFCSRCPATNPTTVRPSTASSATYKEDRHENRRIR